MNKSSQRKRKFSTPCVHSKKQRRTSVIPKALKTNICSSSNVTTKTTKSTRNNGRCQNSPTLIQNNRELATALSKARSRIRELEDQRFELQGDHQQLMEKYSLLNRQLLKFKDERSTKQHIDTKIFKEVCESLHSKLQKATEKLLDSSVFLSEVDNDVATLLKMSGPNQNRFAVELNRAPLEITCDDSIQRSQEVALSITKLTPSPSSASSSESCEMTPPEPSGYSPPSANQLGLLSTIDDHHSVHEASDLHNVLRSLKNSPAASEALDISQESMDCHNNSNSLDAVHTLPGLMDMDSLPPNSDSLVLSSSPDCSPIRYVRSAFHRLASTPEDCEVSTFIADLSVDSPQISPFCCERRTSRRRNTISSFKGYKEPSLMSKLRQGDPFTDCSLYQPSSINKRKSKHPGESLRKKNKK